jgi:type II secretory pathway component PulF
LVLQRTLDDMRLRFWQATAYPLVLLALFLAWVLFMSLWLVPLMQLARIEPAEMNEDIVSLYGSPPVEPLRSPSALVELSRVAPRLFLAACCVLVVAVGVAMAIGGRALLSRMAFLVPLFGRAWWYCAMVEFAGLLSAYLKRELRLGEALALVALAARNPATRAACARAAGEVDEGQPLSQSLAAQAVFPMTLVYLVEWGQRNGTLVDALDTAQRMYADRFDLQVRLARLILPPIVFLLVAGGGLFVAYSIMRGTVGLLQLLTFF